MPKKSSCRRGNAIRSFVALCICAAAMRADAQAGAAGANLIQIDASTSASEPPPSDYREGTSTSSTGQTIGLNSRYLTLDGKPWLPVMGEFHYSRYPEDRWEEEILKMKAGGVQVVATYIFWIHQEEIEGQFDWSGQRDLRRFVQLCAKHGMYVYPRIGPWAHGEARNGGFPDWLLEKVKAPRTNDPAYLEYVQSYFDQIGQQLKGLLWKDGGPVIGIQLENEYAIRGPGAGEEHILRLKKLAIQSGLDVPLYTVTGWDNAAVPAAAVVPVFGGYPDMPWDSSREQLPPSEVYAFRFGSRMSGNMGALGEPERNTASKGASSAYPFLTAEMGGAVEDTYHRRPVLSADDVAAMVPTMLGSGVNLYGTYMFQGGENPEGKLSTLQESQANSKYSTDVPVKSYDFQAPLSEFGEQRESFRKLKLFNYFLNDFGAYLAPMAVHAPARVPKDQSDLSVPRASVRSAGDRGFIFVNNYLRNYMMPERKGMQFDIKLPEEELRVPRTPIDVPSGAYFIWPFNFDLDGARLKYCTAQLFTELEDGAARDYIFFAQPEIVPEFAIASADLAGLEARDAEVERAGGTTYVTVKTLGFGSPIRLKTRRGAAINIFVIEQRQAEDGWLSSIDGVRHLVVTSDQIYFDAEQMHLQALRQPRFSFSVFPEVPALNGSLTLRRVRGAEGVASFEASGPSRKFALNAPKTQAAASAPPIQLGVPLSWRPHGVARAPEESTFDRAAKWQFTLPADAMTGLSELFLKVEYVGDVARLSSDDKLLDDNFYNGLPWSIGLSRYLTRARSRPFVLSILPLRKDAPIFLEKPYRPDFGDRSQIDRLERIQLIPQYELLVNTSERPTRP